LGSLRAPADKILVLTTLLEIFTCAANVSTYNLLLFALDDSTYDKKWDKALELAMKMAEEPAVHPDISK